MTSEQQKKIVDVARSLVGAKYKYAADPTEAPDFFDCSSFTQYCFRQIGISIPRSGILQAADDLGKRITSPDLQPGDVIFMRGEQGHYRDKLFNGEKFYIGHVALVVDDEKIVHAWSRAGKVITESITELTTRRGYKIVLAKRF